MLHKQKGRIWLVSQIPTETKQLCYLCCCSESRKTTRWKLQMYDERKADCFQAVGHNGVHYSANYSRSVTTKHWKYGYTRVGKVLSMALNTTIKSLLKRPDCGPSIALPRVLCMEIIQWKDRLGNQCTVGQSGLKIAALRSHWFETWSYALFGVKNH